MHTQRLGPPASSLRSSTSAAAGGSACSSIPSSAPGYRAAMASSVRHSAPVLSSHILSRMLDDV